MRSLPRQRSKPAAVIGWELDPSLPPNLTPLVVAGQLWLYDAASGSVFFAEACVFAEIHPDEPDGPPAELPPP